MRHQGRMFDQALHAAQTFCKREQLAAFEEALGVIEGSMELCRDHAAEGAHLFFCQGMLRMAREARVIDATHFWVSLKPLRNLERRGAVPLHTQCQRLEA